MGKIYYCDYCDRSFKDEAGARKKHLSSLQHSINHAEHYRQLKDPEEILKEEFGKTPCRKLMNGEDCLFGNNCRFSHYNPQMIWQLQQMVSWKYHLKAQKSAECPDPHEIINEYFQDSLVTGNDNDEINHSIWNIPSELQNHPNLPPSLWPISPETVTDSNFAKWS
ncbi:hypothetical protein HCN44_008518 [Aphidius gifuensis]|uniref:C3H1-type domain-containing protein n=1 Tax=Aphidius gifuensis TaxID=684658 RepID=A0A834XRB9_APHGI|nr:zinc finger matrin-type protein 5 [Aphidius gifuensis]KAF7989844.1 hypothetical protein HCN44_008518 [Aphidius gifuensis]